MSVPIQKQVLLRARAALSDRNCWTQFEVARTIAGMPCTSFDRFATSYCLVGAIQLAAFRAGANVASLTKSIVEELDQHLLDRGRRCNCVEFNDAATHAQVINLVDEFLTTV